MPTRRDVLVRVLLWLVAGSGLLSTTTAQFVQQGDKLVGVGAGGTAAQIFSVALSADGNTALLGGPNDDNAGAVWVYTRAGGEWSQQGGKLVATDAAGIPDLGNSVALSVDGNTALVGGNNDNRTGTLFENAADGAAWVFTRSGGVWSQQGGKLVGTGAVRGEEQGTSVALSADGNTAIVCGLGGNGHAWVYTRSGGVWSQQGDKLVGTGTGTSTSYASSCSVAVSADGSTAILGTWGGDNSGVPVEGAWAYTRAGNVWSEQGPKLVGTGTSGAFPARQGTSVALSADGNTALVGGSFDNNVAGATWVYTRSGAVWSQEGPKLVGIGVEGIAAQGSSVTLSADGNTALIGSPGESGARVYTRSGGVWSEQGGKLTDLGALGLASQGASVALAADGNTALVGGPGDIHGGAGWVFVRASGPTIASRGVVNGASFQPGIAPGTWITISGAYLSATTRSWTSADFSGNNLPTQLDGVSVTVNGKPAYVAYVSPQQLNVLTPDDTTQGAVPVQVTTPQGKTNVVTAMEAALSPALFTFSQLGGQFVAAVRADGTYIGPPNLFPGVTTVPAKWGDTILLFGTGFGPTTPATIIGQLASPAPLTSPATVTIGGSAMTTLFAGIVGPGLYQFNVNLPFKLSIPGVQSVLDSVVVETNGASSQLNAMVTVPP